MDIQLNIRLDSLWVEQNGIKTTFFQWHSALWETNESISNRETNVTEAK